MTREELIDRLSKSRNESDVRAVLEGVTDEQLAQLNNKQTDELVLRISNQLMNTGAQGKDREAAVKAAAAGATQFVADTITANTATKEVEKDPALAGTSPDTKDVATEILELKKKVAANTATKAETDRLKQLAVDNADIYSTVTLSGSAGLRATLSKTMTQLFGDGSDEAVDALKQALSVKYGMSLDGITDDWLTQALSVNPAVQAVGTEVSKKRTAYTTSSGVIYADPAYMPDPAKKVTVDASVDKALKSNITGFDTFGRLAAQTIFDSQERFGGQNIYALWAYTQGFFDPNRDFGDLGPTGYLTDTKELRKAFLRQQLVAAGTLPPYFIDGQVNPLYQPGVSAEKFIDTPGAKQSTMLSTVWENPEMLVDAQWWEKNAKAFNDYLVTNISANDKAKGANNDLMRKFMYDMEKPKFDALLAKYGPGRELAAIVASKYPDLADKMVAGTELTADESVKIMDLFGNMDPASIGIARDSFDHYKQLAAEAKEKAGPTITVIQPDRDKIAEGFKELYRQMFRAEPSPDELGALVNDIAGRYIGAQYARQDFDTSSAMTQAVRGTDIYSQLYGNKPSGLGEAEYIGQFENVGAGMLGGMQAPSAAIQAGMRNNDPNTTAQMVFADQGSWNNSAFLENFYRALQTMNAMT